MRARCLANGSVIVMLLGLLAASPAMAQAPGGAGSGTNQTNAAQGQNPEGEAPGQQMTAPPSAASESGAEERSEPGDGILSGHRGLVGREIRNTDYETIGEIDNIVADLDGRNLQAIVEVGGIWGIGEEKIMVPLERFRLTRRRPYVFFDGTEEDLKSFPAYEEPDVPRPADMAASRSYYPPRDAYEVRRGEDGLMAHRYGRGPGYPYQGPPENRGYYDPNTGIDRRWRTGADRNPGPDHLRASDVIGRTVQNARGEEIGQIEDLMVGPRGQSQLVISVGGFLGMGDKRIRADVADVDLSDPEVARYDISRRELENEPPYGER